MIIEKINNFYKKEEEPRDRDLFYINEVGDCPVKIYYAFKKLPKEQLKPGVYMKFAHGSYAHMHLMSLLFSLGIAKSVEINIPENELFRGRADAIIVIDGEPYIIELKTVNKIGFESLAKPDYDMVKQLQLYLYYFNLNKGIILIENKDTQELKEFMIKKDEMQIKQILNEFIELKKKIESNKIPEKPEELAEWKCDYCVYKNNCGKKD